ncbi:MAG TPA: hypothetical protein PKY13_03320 [Microthrixaceae bacterium]|mgnify:FL=1|nr:hypothetical protein [Microthrixaceae bacterium]
MRVEIGPVGVDTAVAWIAYGRRCVDHLAAANRPSRANVLDRFHSLLDEFADAASAGNPFHWVTDVSPEEVEFVMKGLFEIGLVVEAEHEAGRLPLRPPAADEFHHMVVKQVLAEIEAEGPAFAQFVEGLRGEWGVAGSA